MGLNFFWPVYILWTIGFVLYGYIYYMPEIYIQHAFSTDGSASSSDINSIGL